VLTKYSLLLREDVTGSTAYQTVTIYWHPVI